MFGTLGVEFGVSDQHRVDVLMLALYEHADRQDDIHRATATWLRIEIYARRLPDAQRRWT
jgi:hypothetical protein